MGQKQTERADEPSFREHLEQNSKTRKKRKENILKAKLVYFTIKRCQVIYFLSTLPDAHKVESNLKIFSTLQETAPRLTNGEDSWGTGQNVPPNYANKWRSPPVMVGAI